MIQALAFQPGLRLQGITILLKLAVILYASSHSSGRSLCNSSFGVVSICLNTYSLSLSAPSIPPNKDSSIYADILF